MKIILVLILLVLSCCKKSNNVNIDAGETAILLKAVLEKNDTLLNRYFETNYLKQHAQCKIDNYDGIEINVFEEWLNGVLNKRYGIHSFAHRFGSEFPYMNSGAPMYLSIQYEIEISQYEFELDTNKLNYEFIDSLRSKPAIKNKKYMTSCFENKLNFGDSIKLYGVNDEEKTIANSFVYNDIADDCIIAGYGKDYDKMCIDSTSRYQLLSKYIGVYRNHDGRGFDITSSLHISKVHLIHSNGLKYLIIQFAESSSGEADVYIIRQNKMFEKVKHIQGPVA